MKYIWFGILLASCAAAAAVKCRPEGRATFAAGLEALARGALSVAAAQFANLVQAQPDCAEARNNLAVVEVEQGQLSEAAEELRVAVELRPDYERARSNLQRVEALLARQAALAPEPPALAASPTVTPERAATATVTLAPQPAMTPGLAATVAESPTPAAASQATVPGIVALEPEGASACAIDPTRQRMCVYDRTAQAVVLRACYAFARFHVTTWPRWLIAGDTAGQRIRLLDETGERRLKIIPEHANVAGDVVGLRQNDFDALCASVRPWRTACVLADSAPELEPAMLAALRDALEAWRLAWEQRRFADYVAHYGQRFVPQSDRDVAHWQARKRQLFEQASSITVQVAAPSIFITGDGATAIMLFDQWYRSAATAAHDLKALRWQLQAGVWKITAETVLRPNLPE
jgi:tetratricopeptide (TPR) repeat protein